MKLPEYRGDIDGLRAISAMVIFLFHLGFTSFSGGFVGVDTFFVISGYLIIPKIADQLQDGTFSLKHFFERRIRRILPALFAVLLFSFAVGYFVLGPREYAEFGGSAFATLVFGANFYFYDRSGYFGDAAHQKPFLHAWSLGVEEQFYIIIPLLLLGLWKLRRLSAKHIVLIVTIASFAFNVVMVRHNETNAFFLPMSRFWELGLGGLIALYGRDLKLTGGARNIIALAGTGLLLLAIFWIDEDVRFPGEAALIPVLGSAFLIFAGQQGAHFLSPLLSSRVMTYLGRLSYSIYLIHWPVIVFVRLYLSRPLELTEQVGILVFSLVWAAISWELLEKRALNAQKMKFRHVSYGLGVGLSFLISVGLWVDQSDGIPSRMTEKSLSVSAFLEEERGRYGRGRCLQRYQLGDPIPSKYSICRTGNPLEKSVFSWGDSHAGMIGRGYKYYHSVDDFRFYSVGLPDCPPFIHITTSRAKNREICPSFNNKILQFLRTEKIDTVVLSGRWANLGSDVRSPGDGGRPYKIFDQLNDGAELSFRDAFLRTAKAIREAGAEIIIVGPVPEIAYHVPDTLIRYWSGIGQLPDNKTSTYLERQKIVLETLAELEKLDGVSVIYPQEFLCDDETCRVLEGDKPLYTDDDHLSVLGTRDIVEELYNRLQ
ncbi:MAG: acyltransferase [Sneathiella sp.]|nr:acyltransferase [Sneathiella sp.]